ncbi:hypothetical protein Ahy_A02g006999 [Arachis hypogaea]|uniref:Uncharacterized protein n=1 Tax=Arachis hypogaea TaxID=3818 RepID=A0A445EBI2_ARAHY|nr:hypothetical protein Ahy_A02g006999 [Arachis hypogaea]
MKHKRNISGQSILEELRRQNEDINLSSEDGLEQISLNDDGDEFLETEMLNQSGVDLPEPTASKNKRDENEPLLVKIKVLHAGGSKSYARRATQMEKKLGRPVCRSEVIVSSLLKKDESYVSEEGQRLAEKIAERAAIEDQERAATEGIHSKVLTHPDDVIGKACGPENGKQVRGFSNAACPSDFAHLWRGNMQRFSSASQQHVADLDRQLQEAKDQMPTLHRFLQHKYGDEIPTFSDSVPLIQSD